VQGRGEDKAARLLEDAKALEAAGCYALVLEMIPAELAAEITAALSIPTIGIGAGAQCDGQVLVIYDLLGMNPDFAPRFVKKYADFAAGIAAAVSEFRSEVRSGAFPAEEHSFSAQPKPAPVVAESNGFHPGAAEFETARAAQTGPIQPIEKKVKAKRHWRPRSFTLDFAPGEAISVTRRLYLSGESEYLLNGKTCRLRDIQDLFAGTGLSGSHYAIVEQGRIGQILSAKPGDRRNLIEEAAGISKFRTRQRAAESRLDSAKTNLGRISDIVSEIEKQANSLRRQAS
jgi:hypothetical protein